MGGSAGGYPDFSGLGGGNNVLPRSPMRNGYAGNDPQKRFQSAFEQFMRNQNGGFNGVFGGFGALDAMDRAKARAKANGNSDAPNSDTTTGGSSGNTPSAPTGQWAFPQYTQTWAFTPPAPSPYMTPQPFDPKKYGNPLGKKSVKKNV